MTDLTERSHTCLCDNIIKNIVFTLLNNDKHKHLKAYFGYLGSSHESLNRVAVYSFTNNVYLLKSRDKIIHKNYLKIKIICLTIS